MAATSAASIPQSFLSLSKPKPKPKPNKPSSFLNFQPLPSTSKISLKPCLRNRSQQLVNSVADEFDVIPVQSDDRVDHQDGVVCLEREAEATEVDQVVGGFASERLSFEGAAGFSSAASSVGGPGPDGVKTQEETERLIDRAINATIVLAAGSFAITKLLTIDHDYWHDVICIVMRAYFQSSVVQE